MNDKDNKTRVGSGWDFSDDVPDNKNKSNDRDTFTHFIMGAYGFGKQGDDEAAQTCIDEALEWFDTTCAQRVREARDEGRYTAYDEVQLMIQGIEEHPELSKETVLNWFRKNFTYSVQQDNH